MDEIVNKVAKSPLKQIDLEEIYPKEEIAVFDMKPMLFQEMILREKDFRVALREFDFSVFDGKLVAIHCSIDAIVPTWAYMLVATYLHSHAIDFIFGDKDDMIKYYLKAEIDKINKEDWTDAKIVVKGCGDKNLDAFAYVELTKKLQPVVSSIMYGEPCSTVPVFKQKKKA
ncbi:MAG: DUF2480 family protein [Cyclobacteriaceae bacterium]|nr:DUF2480 family protein [Cyclobacteriaceae bacterium]